MVQSSVSHSAFPINMSNNKLSPTQSQFDDMGISPQATTNNEHLGATNSLQEKEKSMWKKEDFEMGNIVHSKGDREILYLARKKNEFRTIIITIREITKRRLNKAQQDQLQKVAVFLHNIKHENLLQVWGLFWDDKKVYYIQEPAIRVAQLFLPSDQEMGNYSADFIKSFFWQKTFFSQEQKWEFQPIDHINDRDRQLECMEAQKDQKILLKLLYDYVAQLIRLYQYLLEDHKLKNVHIKPYNVLESANCIKVYDLQVSNLLITELKNIFV